MRVDYITVDNIEILEQGYNEGILNPEDKIVRSFTMHYDRLLSHIKVTYKISDLTMLEVFFLNRYSNGSVIDIETYFNDQGVNEVKNLVLQKIMRSLFILNNSIDSDTDVIPHPGFMLYPGKYIQKTVVCSFTGNQLTMILGDINRGSDSFFQRVKKRQETFPDHTKLELIKDELISSFYSSFYRAMITDITSMDLLSDAVLSENYLDKAYSDKPTDPVVLSHVNTMYGNARFLGVSKDLLSLDLDNINKNKAKYRNTLTDSEEDLTELNRETSEIFFVCNATLYSFIEMSLRLPLKNISEFTDIKFIYNEDNYIIPENMGKYTNRLISLYEKVKTERNTYQDNINKEENNGTIDIDKYNYIFLNSRILFTLKFNFNEISSIIPEWEEEIKNGYYGDLDTYIPNEILTILSNIKETSISLYKALV